MAPKKPGFRVAQSYVTGHPDADPTATELVINAIAVGQWMVHRMDEVLRPHGLATGSFGLLQIVAGDAEPLTPSQIVARASVPITSATVTGLLDTCARRGFIERRPHPSDRRKVMVVITPAGRELLDEVERVVIAGEKRWTSVFTKGDRRAVTDELGRLSDHLRSPASAPPPLG